MCNERSRNVKRNAREVSEPSHHRLDVLKALDLEGSEVEHNCVENIICDFVLSGQTQNLKTDCAGTIGFGEYRVR